MNFPLVLVLYTVLCLLCLPYFNEEELNDCCRDKRIAIIFMAIGAILIGGLRTPFWGSGDVGVYKAYFERDIQLPLEIICTRAYSDWKTDESYYVLAKLYSLIIPNFQSWMFLLCAMYITPCAVAIYKWSKYPPLAFLYLIFLDNYYFTWNGLKQCIAMSLCIWAFIFLEKKKITLFIVLLMVAYSFHISAIIYLLGLIAFFMPVKLWNFAIIAGPLLFSFMLPSFVRWILHSFLADFDGFSAYIESDIALNFKMYFLMLFMYLVFFWFRNHLHKQSKINDVFINMSLFGVCLNGFSYVIAEFFRVAFYFTIFNMILIGNISTIESVKARRMLIQFFIVIFLIFVFLMRGGLTYRFFWENPYVV